MFLLNNSPSRPPALADPGSFWMGFLKSWGPVQMAEVFFRKAAAASASESEKEAMVSIAVQFRERETGQSRLVWFPCFVCLSVCLFVCLKSWMF